MVTLNSPATDRTGANSTRSALLEFGLIVILAALPWLWRWQAGAGEFPAGDAWAYEKIFDTFHSTGQLRLVDWNDITFVGMIPVTEAWVTAVGYGPTQLYLLGSVMCVVAVLAVRSLLITYGANNRLPILAIAAGSTGFVSIAGTYLSDSFAVAGALWAVALAARVTESSSRVPFLKWTLVGASAFAASYGFLVRQQMVVGILGAGWLFWRYRDRCPRALTLFSALVVVTAIPIYLWRSAQPNGGQLQLTVAPAAATAGLEGLLIATGIVVFVAMRWLPEERLSKRAIVSSSVFAGGVYVVLLASSSLATPSEPIIESMENMAFPVSAIVVLTMLLVASLGWREFAVSASRTAGLRGGHGVLRTVHTLHPMLVVALIGIAVELLVILMTGAYFVRYSMFVWCVTLVFLGTRRLQVSLGALMATAALIAASFWSLDASTASTGALLDAASITQCLGIPPERFDGGFSWNGKHYRGIASSTDRTPAPNDGLPPTVSQRIFPSLERDAVLVPTDPGSDDGWKRFGPLRSQGLLPGTSTEQWLVVRSSAALEERCG